MLAAVARARRRARSQPDLRGEDVLLATVFLVGYFITSPIFGRLADRGTPRKVLIAIGVAVWSLATIGNGVATNFWHLVAMRALVEVSAR